MFILSIYVMEGQYDKKEEYRGIFHGMNDDKKPAGGCMQPPAGKGAVIELLKIEY
jgi:hypothetical protein